MTPMKNTQHTVNFADEAGAKPQAGDGDDASISSKSSSSSVSVSKDFVEDSTSDTKSSSKRSHTTGTIGNSTNWLDGEMDATKSSTLVIVVIVIMAVVLGSVTFAVMKNKDRNAFQTKVEDLSSEIFQVIHERSQHFASSLQRISMGVTLGGKHWPFYTAEKLDAFAQDLLEEDPEILVSYAPLVSQEHRESWEAYATAKQDLVTTDPVFEDPHLPIPPRPNVSKSIYRFVQGSPVDELPTSVGPYSPAWQIFPRPSLGNISAINLNLLSNDIYARLAEASILTRSSVMSEVEEPQELWHIPVLPNFRYQPGPQENPQRLVVVPVLQDFEQEAAVVGHIAATQPWASVFHNILEPTNTQAELTLVVSDSCTGRSYTYQVMGNATAYVGAGDLHETKFDHMGQSMAIASYTSGAEEAELGHCSVELSIYPTTWMEARFDSNAAVGYLLLVLFLAAALMMAFTTYNKTIEKQQQLMQIQTQRSNAIIASLFPEQIRTKLFGEDGALREELKLTSAGAQQNIDKLFKSKGSSGLGVLGFDDDAFEQKQLADLYPYCTVIFADISGFTAWSSTRDPAQVFQLLETVFRSFDEIAKRRRVFKVETIGDCYLAACGLPDPRRDHAMVMARFARDILEKFHQVTRMLEVSLGPDTGELGLRSSLHSGPITAGVLRGEKGRFQLFGDTVNTGSRLESTGEPNRIHISKDTAELIQASGKGNWVKPRGELVQAKGKGTLETFWLLPKSRTRSSVTHSSTNSGISGSNDSVTESRGLDRADMPSATCKEQSEAKLDRLIFWVSESLASSLRQVVARRNATSKPVRRGPARESVRELEEEMSKQKISLDEVCEVITLPKYDAEAVAKQVDPRTVNLGHDVETQLREYVTVIASLYQDNPFHNFHHASHVQMSIMKLLSRIVAPHHLQELDTEKADAAENLHDYTYGITSCPLTQFAVLFSAIIHDVDHRGISNADLCKENEILAKIFKHKSVAEQNSIDLAWQALMDPSFQDLRDCIYTDATELRRFRQLIVNCVLATDIFDKELSALRKKRWEKAFQVSEKDETEEDIHRKATIVIEHLIQASDVSHTMQHWQVYLKWNEHFFEEQYTAYLQGRNTGNDPSVGWYKGEIWFFDNYVIPLAKKLKNCGVFGVSSDEYYNYARMNRDEWEKKGEEVVAGFIRKYGEKHGEVNEKAEVSVSEVEAPSVTSTAPTCASYSDPMDAEGRTASKAIFIGDINRSCSV